jgi:hypothetical protein
MHPLHLSGVWLGVNLWMHTKRPYVEKNWRCLWNLLTLLDSTVNIIWGNLYDHLVTQRISNLVNEKDIYPNSKIDEERGYGHGLDVPIILHSSYWCKIFFSHKVYVRVGRSSTHRWKMNNYAGRFCTRSFDCATNSWCEVVIKGTRDKANATMQPWLVSGSPIGHAYTNYEHYIR